MASMPAAWPRRASSILKAGAADRSPADSSGSAPAGPADVHCPRPARLGELPWSEIEGGERAEGSRRRLAATIAAAKLSRLPGASRPRPLARNQVVFLSPGWGRECRCQPGAGWLRMPPDISGSAPGSGRQRERRPPGPATITPHPGGGLGSAPLAQSAEHSHGKAGVVGSIPTGGSIREQQIWPSSCCFVKNCGIWRLAVRDRRRPVCTPVFRCFAHGSRTTDGQIQQG